MRGAGLSVLTALMGCLPSRDLPEISGQSMFVAVELEDGQYEVYSSEVKDGVANFPAIVVDGDRRVDVYFFGCGRGDLTAGETALLESRTVPPSIAGDSHPRPLSAFTTEIADGAIEEWRPKDDAGIDLGLSYPCAAIDGWTTTLPEVEPASAWMWLEDSTIWVGSAAGMIHQIDMGGQIASSTSGPVLLALTNVGEQYLGIVREGDFHELWIGNSPTSLAKDRVQPYAPNADRIRLRGAPGNGEPQLAVVDAAHKFRMLDGLHWTDERDICSCATCMDESSNVHLLHDVALGFIAGAPAVGCLGKLTVNSSDTIELPESSGSLGGMDSTETHDLIISTGAGLYCRRQGEWLSSARLSNRGAVSVGSDAVLVLGPDQLTAVVADGPLCMSTTLRVLSACNNPIVGQEVIMTSRSARGTFVLTTGVDGVRVTQLLVGDLNTCSG